MTHQDVYDHGLLAVRMQGGPGISPWGRCSYRGMDGRKCIAGHLLTDAEYDPQMEGFPVSRLASFPGRLDFARKLIAAMQNAHDNAYRDVFKQGYGSDRYYLDYFELRMRKVAAEFGLIYTNPDGSPAEEPSDVPVVKAFDRKPDRITGNAKGVAKLVANVFLIDLGTDRNMLVAPSVVNKRVNHSPPTGPTAQDVLVERFEVYH